MNDQPEPHRELVDFAEDARRAVRSLNHASRGGALPGPAVYDLTGTLKNVGLPQLYEQLAIGLELSLAVYDVKEDDGADSLLGAGPYGRDRAQGSRAARNERSRELGSSTSRSRTARVLTAQLIRGARIEVTLAESGQCL